MVAAVKLVSSRYLDTPKFAGNDPVIEASYLPIDSSYKYLIPERSPKVEESYPDDLLEIAYEKFGITNPKTLPPLSELGKLLETENAQETIAIIRDMIKTDEGIDLIKMFIENYEPTTTTTTTTTKAPLIKYLSPNNSKIYPRYIKKELSEMTSFMNALATLLDTLSLLTKEENSADDKNNLKKFNYWPFYNTNRDTALSFNPKVHKPPTYPTHFQYTMNQEPHKMSSDYFYKKHLARKAMKDREHLNQIQDNNNIADLYEMGSHPSIDVKSNEISNEVTDIDEAMDRILDAKKTLV